MQYQMEKWERAQLVAPAFVEQCHKSRPRLDISSKVRITFLA
jgi:hypothetical protein